MVPLCSPALSPSIPVLSSPTPCPPIHVWTPFGHWFVLCPAFVCPPRPTPHGRRSSAMAYRRRSGNPSRISTYEDFSEPSTPSSLAAQAIRAHPRDSSLAPSFPGESAVFASGYCRPDGAAQVSNAYEYNSVRGANDSRNGFWGVLARKAKSILEDEHAARQFEKSNRVVFEKSNDTLSYPSLSQHKSENPSIQKRLDAISYSLNNIGGRLGNAFEEGVSMAENKATNIRSTRRKGNDVYMLNQATDAYLQAQTDFETQLKASRDVANAMAAKAKLLLRELKTLKADLAFAKQRSAQLEEENRILRESSAKGDDPEDDDLIRLQLETLVAEKARLAHENSVYARENRFLREVVEYHQLTMQDVVYLDEGTEDVTEVYQISTPSRNSSRSPSPSVPRSSSHPPLPSKGPSPRTLSPQTSLASHSISPQLSITAGAFRAYALAAAHEAVAAASGSDDALSAAASAIAPLVAEVQQKLQQEEELSTAGDHI